MQNSTLVVQPTTSKNITYVSDIQSSVESTGILEKSKDSNAELDVQPKNVGESGFNSTSTSHIGEMYQEHTADDSIDLVLPLV